MTWVDLNVLTLIFKQAWNRADREGLTGARSRAGIKAVLEELLVAPGDRVVAELPAYQGLTIWLGDDEPLSIDDTLSLNDLKDLVGTPLQRAVLCTRLQMLLTALMPDEDPQAGEDR
ncbi:MAG: hypothetical protein QM638_01075 [Nocardioides sp.]|uniref:hypothetical protein n=1 Tax=Nocardioides sp. TaxID=35761 RepID=UPI0039E59C94